MLALLQQRGAQRIVCSYSAVSAQVNGLYTFKPRAIHPNAPLWKHSNAPLRYASTSSNNGLDATKRSGSGYIYTKGAGVFGALGHGDALQDVATFKQVHVHAGAGTGVETSTGHTVGMLRSSSTGNSASSSSSNAENHWKPLLFKQISAGWGHSAAVTHDGRVFMMGRPYDFSNLMQLNRLRTISPGLGRFVGRFTSWFGSPDSDDGLYTSPVEIIYMPEVSTVSATAGMTLLHTAAGDLYAFGLNRWGQCGIDQATAMIGKSSNTQGMHIFTPTRLPLPGIVTSYDTGLQHCIALVSDTNTRAAPVTVGASTKAARDKIGRQTDTAEERTHAYNYTDRSQRGGRYCGMEHKNLIYTWGKGLRGQLGVGDFDSTHTPAVISLWHPDDDKNSNGTDADIEAEEERSEKRKNSTDPQSIHPRDENPIQVSAGFAHTACVTQSGNVYVWGKGMSVVPKSNSNNDAGAGAGTSAKVSWKVSVYEDQLRPRKVRLPPGVLAVEVISSNFSLVIRDASGRLWALGMGEYDRNMIVEPVPVQKAILGQLDYNEDAVAQAVLSPSTMLKKGHQRVVLIPSSASSADTADTSGLCQYESQAAAFEVVLHQAEAYLQEVSDLNFPVRTDAEAGAGAGAGAGAQGQRPQLVDYSSGWKHTCSLYSV